MEERIEYLESRIPEEDRNTLEKKHSKNFSKYARYMGNGVYKWKGMYSTDTRELFLLGILKSEGIEFKEE